MPDFWYQIGHMVHHMRQSWFHSTCYGLNDTRLPEWRTFVTLYVLSIYNQQPLNFETRFSKSFHHACKTLSTPSKYDNKNFNCPHLLLFYVQPLGFPAGPQNPRVSCVFPHSRLVLWRRVGHKAADKAPRTVHMGRQRRSEAGAAASLHAVWQSVQAQRTCVQLPRVW